MVNKDIKDYLHLYLGCEAYWQVDGVRAYYTRKIDGWMLENCDWIKPILRPLSDMTEEEKRNAVDPMTYGLQHGLKKNICEQAAELVNYLRSKFIDVDGLIEAGLAIDKTTLK